MRSVPRAVFAASFHPFHRGVFEAFRNIPFTSRLALINTEHEARPGQEKA
ncbi:hypothetical protein V1288_004368 [Bradyrhizobium sp. AZCC 2176]